MQHSLELARLELLASVDRKSIVLIERLTQGPIRPTTRPKAQARPEPDFGNLGTWTSRNLESKKCQKYKFSKSKSVLPKMSARSGLAGKKQTREAHLGPSQAIFSMDRKNQNMCKNRLFSLVGQWALFTRFGVMCWCHLLRLWTSKEG